jgi:hypothetical protein
MDQHEATTAEIAGAWQRHGERESDGDGGIHGVATLLQDFDTDPAGLGLLARHHAVLGKDRLLCRRQRRRQHKDDNERRAQNDPPLSEQTVQVTHLG